ncbi:DNA repair protein RecO [bacterium]|nr:DNA repair protein RecO [bacterium]
MICKGYILEKLDYKEKDLIVTMLTENHGINSFLVPDGKKKEGFLQFFDLVEFLILDGTENTALLSEFRNTLSRITQLCTLKSNTQLIKNSFCYLSTGYFIEVIRALVPSGMKIQTLFSIMHSLPVTNQIEFVKKLIILLKYFGFYPDIYSCSECGKNELLEYGVVSEMMFLCSDCSRKFSGSKVKLGSDFFKILEFIEKTPASSLVISNRQFETISNFFSGYLKFNHNVSLGDFYSE